MEVDKKLIAKCKEYDKYSFMKLCKMYEKYLYSLLIGKVFLIIFWGFIGTTLINSIKNPINLVYITIMLVICYIISKLVSKREGL